MFSFKKWDDIVNRIFELINVNEFYKFNKISYRDSKDQTRQIVDSTILILNVSVHKLPNEDAKLRISFFSPDLGESSQCVFFINKPKYLFDSRRNLLEEIGAQKIKIS